ncbi:dUTP pyrophosphatase [Clostridium amylolyticum]|uniref:Deoxyuridine 5'-triphosphate nucleotidohydrolase n=1 Tax=Clostridium amylolyticum TaxID=1121298 RepID=A0A1M6B2E0_9CLOT|nr:dUTP diphosphatase [Clostridium amylolyticum]SHI42885.1 dUTP pyrophosphatase [Clostridium amylolyticum]
MNNLTLKVIKINKDAILPNYAHVGDAGLDLFSVDKVEIKPNETAFVATGIKIELPPHTEAQIRPRSGLALKHGITVLNTPGTIDEGYRGELKIILINHGKEAFIIEKGMKIAQMVVMPVYAVNVIEVNELSESTRGEGGFGSTGLNK